MPAYETTEASHLIQRALDKLYQRRYAEEAKALAQQVFDLLKAQNIEPVRTDDGFDLHVSSAHVLVRCRVDRLYIATAHEQQQQQDPRQWFAANIEFDPVAECFVGLDVDTSHVPLPGNPASPRRNALAVVVEAIVKKLEQSAAETAPRT